MKKNRTTLSFEPEPEVSEMLKKAKTAGLTQGEILNEAMKTCGRDVIKKMAEKRTLSLQTLSFFDAQLLLAGFNSLAIYG